MRHLITSVVAGAGILALAASAQAALIGLTGGNPDVTCSGVNISYTALTTTTGTFVITAGTPVTENPGSIPVNTPSSFTLTVDIDYGPLPTDPVTVTSGTLTLTGDVGGGSQPLFSSSVTPQFGFSTGSNTPSFDVLFGSGSGELDGGGGQIGLILHSGTNIPNYSTNLFTQSFSNTFAGTADVVGSPVGTGTPEPASLSLAALGCAGLLARRRRR